MIFPPLIQAVSPCQHHIRGEQKASKNARGGEGKGVVEMGVRPEEKYKNSLKRRDKRKNEGKRNLM
jgi:hypothetical protein